jgi:hypothetical protein
MQTSNYDLEIFDDLMSGQLCPENVTLSSSTQLVDYLNAHCGQCKKITVATVKKRNHLYQISKICSLTNAHPLVHQFQLTQTELFEWNQCSSLAQEIIDELKIDRNKVLYMESSGKHAVKEIRIEHLAEWSELPMEQLKFYYFSALLRKECDSIRKRIQSKVFNLPDKQNTDFYIYKLQRYMIEVSYDLMKAYDFNLDTLSHSIKDNYSDCDIYTMVYIHLEELIAFVEKNYLEHIDDNVSVPFNSTLYSVYNLSEKISRIHERLELVPIEPELRVILQAPLFKVNSRSLEGRMTYRELMYHIQFITNLFELLSTEEHCSEDRIISFCFELNFNDMKFIEYLIDKMKREIDRCSTEDEVDQMLRKELKLVHQQQLHTRKSFNDRSQPLKTYLVHWLEQEILFLERKLEKSISAIPHQVSAKEHTKIDLNLSVPQLGFLLRLFCDSGIIQATSKQEMMRSISAICRTSKVNSISVKSLNNSFYEQDEQTLASVKHILIKMIGELNAGKY